MAELKHVRIGDVLLDYGYITEEQMEQALAYQKTNPSMRIGDIFITLGYITEGQMEQALAKRFGVQFVDLNAYTIDSKAVMLVPRNLAERYVAIPIGFHDRSLLVAVGDPSNLFAVEDLKLVTGRQIEIVVALPEQIKEMIRHQYAEVDAMIAATAANTAAEAQPAEEDLAEVDLAGVAAAAESSLGDNNETPMIRLLNSLLVKGYTSGASDIHIEPFEDFTAVRMRIDGMLIEYMQLSRELHLSIIARLKIMSGLNIAERRIPQDGHFREVISGNEMNIRLSTIPTVFGEKAVIRFLSTNMVLDNAEDFGMMPSDADKLRSILQSPHGVVYITGPTGSGKTTTLYMVLEHLAHSGVNIVTVEDPVERNIAKVNQVQVNVSAGLTFDVGLRSILRQDPDIIMVGETRDSETASISVRSAITGHLVLSTIHTNDAAGTITRLRDMGIEPYLVANSIIGIVAQRLVRKVCPNCAQDVPTDEVQRAILGADVMTTRRGKGCHLCNHTGYKGRQAVHEIIEVDKQIRRMIIDGSSPEQIEAYAKTKGFTSLRESLTRMVIDGVTTFDELTRLTYYI